MDRDPILQPDSEVQAELAGASRGRWVVRWAAYVIGFVALGVCVWLAIEGGREGGTSGWARLREASPWDGAGLAGLVLASVLVNGFLFWLLIKPFEEDRPVPLLDMEALVAATSLLNYLPMRAGLIGRVAYLKRTHAISIRTSLLMLAVAAGAMLAVFALAAALLLAAWWLRAAADASLGADAGTVLEQLAAVEIGPLWIAGFIAAQGVAAVAGLVALRWTVRRSAGVPGAWMERKGLRPATLGLAWVFVLARGVDLVCYAGRIWFACRILGWEVTATGALVFGLGQMAATILTPLPNGLGVREALGFALAAAGAGGGGIDAGHAGLTVILVDRAAEVIVFVSTGLLALAYLHRRATRGGIAEATEQAGGAPEVRSSSGEPGGSRTRPSPRIDSAERGR